MGASHCVWLFIAVAAFWAFAKEQLRGDEPKTESVPVPIKKPSELKFKHDSFTFVRVKYTDKQRSPSGRWATDYPDSDRNLSSRFAKDTGLTTNSDGKVLSLIDPTLKQFPFIYLVEPGSLRLD